MNAVCQRVGSRLATIGGTLFLEDALLGACLLIGCWLHPQQGLTGALAVAGASAVAVGVRPSRRPAFPELLNAMLWGLFLGMVLPLSLRVVLLAILGGALVGAGTLWLETGLIRRTGIGTVLSLPFAVGVVLTALVLPDSIPLAAPHGQQGIQVFLQSLSVVTFTADPFLGLTLLALLLVRSRTLVAGAVLGYLLGWVTEFAVTGQGVQPSVFAGLNYVLVGMAVSGGLLPMDRNLPGRFVISIVAVGVLQVALARWFEGRAWLAVTVPFNVLTLCWITLDPNVKAHVASVDLTRSPERRWRNARIATLRFPSLPPALHLPVMGEWTVYQGENGPWTHRHAWAHAVDLVLTGPQGATHTGRGTHLTDFYAWDKNVISPVQGVVEAVVSDQPDQTPGCVDTEANWGNYVILRSPEGWRVLMAHLRQYSIQVAPGQSVAVGQWIGRCGNSGYSPEPHLHVHVQQEPFAGAATIPFTFTRLVVDRSLDLPAVPERRRQVESRELQPDLLSATSYLLDQKLVMEDQTGTRRTYRIELAPSGAFRLLGEGGFLDFGRWQDAFRIYEVSGKDVWLNQLADALPGMPLTARIGDQWTDRSPRTGKVVHLTRTSATTLETGEGVRIEISPDFGVTKVESSKRVWTLMPDTAAVASSVDEGVLA